MGRKDRNIIEKVADYIEDVHSDEEAVDIISELYQMVIELVRENGVLEHENAMLNRQLNIAEAWILRGGEIEIGDDDDDDKDPHLLS